MSASDAAGRPGARAKALLQRELLDAATAIRAESGGAGLIGRDRELLADLVALSWPDGVEDWAVKASLPDLARRLTVSKDTIRRSLRRLAAAGLIELETGDGRQRSRITIRNPRPRERVGTGGGSTGATRGVAGGASEGSHRCHPGSSNPATRGVAPAPPLHQDSVQGSTSSSTSSASRPGAQAPAMSQLGPRERALFELIARKPDWLREGQPWIDDATARTLACDPACDPDVVAFALSEARQRGRTLRNPAGYAIKVMRSPDLDAIRRRREARRRLAERGHLV